MVIGLLSCVSFAEENTVTDFNIKAEISSVTANKTVVKFTNASDEDVTGLKVYAVKYNKNGVVLGAQMKEVNVWVNVFGNSVSFNIGGNVKVYIWDKNMTPVHAVLEATYTSPYTAEESIMVVKRVARIIDSSDKETLKITGVKEGQEITVIVHPDECLTVNDVKAYNAIIYATTGGYATDVTVLMDNSIDGLADEINLAYNMTNEMSNKQVSLHFGLVEESSTTSFVIEDGEFYYGDDVNFITVDYRYATPTIKNGKKSDVKASDVNPIYVLVKTDASVDDEVTDVIVFRGIE